MKTVEHLSKTPLSGAHTLQRVGLPAKTIVNNRPQAIAQRKLQEAINVSPRQVMQQKRVHTGHAVQRKQYTGMSAIIQREVKTIPNTNPQQWESTLIPKHSFASQYEAQQAENNLHTRLSGMIPLPLAFGSGAPYGFYGFPQMGNIAPENIEQTEIKVQKLAPMLHTLSPQNHQFNTSEPPRDPTLYFRGHGTDRNGQPISSSGRVRQQHDDGPAIFIDSYPRNDYFSYDVRMLDIKNECDLEDDNIEAVNFKEAEDGMHHIEVHHNDPNHTIWAVAHASGGRLSTDGMTDKEIDEAILKAALSAKDRNFMDRRR